MATVHNAAKTFGGELAFQAAIPLHPCVPRPDVDVGEIGIPMFFATGVDDSLCDPSTSVDQFEGTPSSVPKVLVNLEGVNHFEPNGLGDIAWNESSIRFLNCFLKDSQEDCDYVFKGEMCERFAEKYGYVACVTLNGPSSS